MSNMATATGEEFVVLQDAAGHSYVLPRQAIEAGRVADESAAALAALIADEVSGYGVVATEAHPFAGAAVSQLSARSIIIVGGLPALTNAGIIIIGGRG